SRQADQRIRESRHQQINSSPVQHLTNSSPHQNRASAPETKSNGTKLIQPITTRDELERNEVNSSVHQLIKSSNHQFTTRDEVERNEVKSTNQRIFQFSKHTDDGLVVYTKIFFGKLLRGNTGAEFPYFQKIH